MISGTTKVFALLGEPVRHSLSPRMHNAAFLALGLDAAYVALPCDADQVGPLMRALVRAGGGGNVTVPHKAVAAATVDQKLQAELAVCNTFWGEEDRLVGDNTDVTGILDGLRALGAPPTAWLVLGTGGSGRAAVEAARLAGAGVAIRSRDPARAALLEAEILRQGGRVVDAESCEVVINATPLGLVAGDPLPMEPGLHPAVRFALDMVYGAGGTAWVRAMRSSGIQAADGRTVLVAQGAAAFGRWFPGRDAPVEVMRAAVHAALG
jgi:shikimate dehydrogenase